MATPARAARWTRAEYDRLVARGILHEDEPVELIAGQILLKGRYPVVEHGWTRAEYDRLVSGSLLPERGPVELLGGALVCAEPQGSRHATAVDLAADALRLAFGAGWLIRTEKPLALGDESEPEPDLAVVAGARRDYRDAHPTTAALVVEVAESSLDADRAHKGSLYARAGLPEYWIINLVDHVVEVYRGVEPDAAAALGWRYRDPEVLGPSGAVSPLAAPAARVAIADLLP